VDSVRTDTVNVINDIATAAGGSTIYEFYQIPFTEFRDASNNPFATATDAATYITNNGNVIDVATASYQGLWDADTNTPDVSVTTPLAGDFYFISVEGTTTLGDSSEWKVNDRVMYNGTSWQRLAAKQLIDSNNRSVLLSTNTAIFADGEHASSDPENRTPGWYYKNTENNKINWYFFGDNQNTNYTLGDLDGFYAVVDFRNVTSQPYITIYTTMESDGNDGGTWYRSRINYLDNTTLGNALTAGAAAVPAETKFLVHSAGMDVSGIEIGLTRVPLVVDSATTEGPQANSEELYLMALSTSSGRTADSEEFVVEKVGYKLGTYIQEFQLASPATTGPSTDDQTPSTLDFSIEETNTTILVDDGKQFGVNSIRAISKGDGTIDIVAHPGEQVIYGSLEFGNITVSGQAPFATEAATANALNSLFEVSPLGSGGDYAPTYPTLTGVEVTGTNAEGTTPTTTKSDNTTLHYLTTGADTGGHGARFWSTETIDTSGEYFTVKVTGNGRFIIGFADGTTDTNDSGTADDLEELANNSGSAHSGLLWSQAFYDYGSYTAPWTWYGSSSSGNYGPGWTGATTGMMRYNTDVQAAIDPADDSDGALFKAGINEQGYLAVWYYDSGRTNDWVMCSRRSLTTDGSKDYHLVVKLWNGNATLVELPERVATDPAAPALAFRYIESPDGNFDYPLFATPEEAEFYDQNHDGTTGSGTSHMHVYVDDPTYTQWHMPDTGRIMNGATPPQDVAHTVFMGQAVNYTEIPTQDDSLHAPPAFSIPDYTFSENATVNIQVSPQDASWTTTVNGLPAGLSFDGAFLVSGTTPFVSSDVTSVVTVTRTNAFGSSSTTFSLTVSDNASLGDLSGYTEYGGNMVQPNRIILTEDALLDWDETISPGEEMTYSFSQIPPTFGILNSTGETARDSLGTNVLGDTAAYNFGKTDKWALRFVTFGGYVGASSMKHNLVGWTDNSFLTGAEGTNQGVEFKLEYGMDGYMRLYEGGVLIKTSATTFSGAQTITIAGFDDQQQTDIYIPANLTVSSTGAGGTQPPTGFVNPLEHGTMDSSTHLGGDSVAQLTMTLDVGKRVILPKSFVETNILPNLTGSLEKAYWAVPKTTANWTSVDLHADFDAVVRWEWTSNTSHKLSQSVGNSANANHTNIGSLTDAYYDYALEWDGTDLHVIACNINDINTQPGVSDGGSFSRVYSYLGYNAVRTGSLPMVFATKTGGSMELTTAGIQVIDIPSPPAPTITTPWTKALDFSGSAERTQQVSSATAYAPITMDGVSTTVAAPGIAGNTSSDVNARPWATAVVFKVDGHNSNQHIWNCGEGASTGDDNIYLRLTSDRRLRFGWGRVGVGTNECVVHPDGSSTSWQLNTGNWYAVYIAHTGERLSGANASAANLADCFDIRIAGSSNAFAATGYTDTNVSTETDWVDNGFRMDRTNGGPMTVGGRGANRSFHGKVASMVVTTLPRGAAMPSDAEIHAMVTDPVQWVTDYKLGNNYRVANQDWNNSNFQRNDNASSFATQVWLMGDTQFDGFAQMRNYIYPGTQNFTPLNMVSMVSNDIQNVTINGLS
jgi:hypothetical protein